MGDSTGGENAGRLTRLQPKRPPSHVITFWLLRGGAGGFYRPPPTYRSARAMPSVPAPRLKKPLSPAPIGQRPGAASGGNGKGGATPNPGGQGSQSIARGEGATAYRSARYALGCPPGRLLAAGCFLLTIYPQRGRRRAAALKHRRRAAGYHAWKAGNGATAPPSSTAQRG